MTSAIEELCRMLDERGADYRVSATGYSIDIGPYTTAYANRSDTTLDVSLRQVTPEQAIAATLGSCNCSNDCTNGERTGTCLPHFWTHDGVLHIELPKLPDSIQVRMPDQRDREVRSARVWQYVRDSGTCHDEGDPGDFCCSECGVRMFTDTSDTYTMIAADESTIIKRPNYCPNCGRKVVDDG